MSKEWLEFLAGLFGFLAVIIPIIRSLWRTLRRKISLQGLVLALPGVLTMAALLLGFAGLQLGWNHTLETCLFAFSLLGLVGMFSFPPAAPVTRAEIGILVLSAVVIAAFAMHEFNALDASVRNESTQEITAPSPDPN